jgi:hypothetical protein
MMAVTQGHKNYKIHKIGTNEGFLFSFFFGGENKTNGLWGQHVL